MVCMRALKVREAIPLLRGEGGVLTPDIDGEAGMNRYRSPTNFNHYNFHQKNIILNNLEHDCYPQGSMSENCTMNLRMTAESIN